MREYDSREEAERDPDLNLMIVWECDNCGDTYEDRPGCNEGGRCPCGGEYRQVGESYNSI